MNKKLLKFSLICVTGTLIITAKPNLAMAYEQPVAGFTGDKISINTSSSEDGTTIASLAVYEIPIPGYANLGIAKVDNNLSIRTGPGEDYKIIGKLPKNGACEIIGSDKSGWTKITAKTSSSELTGYVASRYLIIGTEAKQLAKEVGQNVATAKVDGLNVRKEPSTDSTKLDIIAKGEELIVLNSKIITDDNEHGKWVQVRLDSEDNEDGDIGYVAREYVNLSFELVKAVSIKELEYGTSVSSKRINLVNFAKDYLGGTYIWGGTRLGVGVDCSGFTQAVYREFGYSIPRTSSSQGGSGTTIKASNIKPGDLVFYGNTSSGHISHVAIFIGNGRVIHSSNKRDGIKISNMYYRQPVKCVRYIND